MNNDQATVDVSRARTGKDAIVYNGDGLKLAHIDSFQAQANFNNATYQPLGCTMELQTPNTVGVDITWSEIVIDDDQYIKDVIAFIGTGKHPDWSVQGVLLGDGENNEERVKYSKCVPSGTIDIQNLTVGDVIKRNMSMHCNSAPQLISALTYER